jgi:integrase
MKRSLTDDMFRKARPRPGKERDTVYDTRVSGLMLRLGRTGNTFAVKYRLKGAGRAAHQRTITLTSAKTVDTARRAALQYLDEAAHGKDPAAEIQKQRADQTEAAERCMAHILKPDGEYERSLKQRRRSNIKTVMSSLTRTFKAIFSCDLRELGRQDFTRELDKLAAAGKPGAYDDAKKFVVTFLNWCAAKGIITANVLAGMKEEKKTNAQRAATEKRKARALGDDELVKVWTACAHRGVFGRVVRLLLLTGCRKSEISKLTRDRLRPDRIVFGIINVKQGRHHFVPRTKLISHVLAEQLVTTSKYVFPSEKTRNRPLSGWTKLVAQLQQDSGVDFRLHDCRRTVRTLFTRFGLDKEFARECIGQKSNNALDDLYDFYDQFDRRKQAFDHLSAHIETLLDAAARKTDLAESTSFGRRSDSKKTISALRAPCGVETEGLD